MEATVAATAGSQSTIQPGASAAGKANPGADGQFGLLMQGELAGQAQGKLKDPKDAADSMSMLAALMQYGALFSLASTQTADTQAQQPSGQAQASPQGADQSTPAAAMGLSAAQAFTAQALTAQALAGLAGQAAAAFLDPAAQAQAPQTQTTSEQAPAMGAQSAAALGEIRQLFTELIAEGAQIDPTPKTESTRSEVKTTPKAEAAASPVPDVTDPLLLALSEALQAAGSQDAAQGEAQAFDSGDKPGKSASSARLPDKTTEAAAFKAEAPDAGREKQTSSGEQTGSARGQALAPQTLSSPAAKPAAQAKAPERAFDSLVERITSMQNSGQKQMEISLKPDSLGKVVIKLTMGADGLVAKIAASNPKVQDAFANSASTLQNSLAQQGLKDVRVIVTSTGVQDAAMQQNSDGQSRQHQGQGKHRNPVIVQTQGLSAAGEPLQAYDLPARAGSVNCLA